MDEHTPLPAPLSPPRAWWRRLAGLSWRGLLWLPGTLLGTVLAGGAAFWLWAGTDGSLAHALAWAQRWQTENAAGVGQVEIDGVRGNLVAGGTMEKLAWSRDGMSAQAEGVQIDLGAGFWFAALRGHVQVSRLQMDTLRVSDARPARSDDTPTPPTSVTLPLPIDANLEIDRVIIEGPQSLTVTELKARYRHGPADSTLQVAEAHTLDIASLQMAGGRYRAQVTLGAQAPMPLRLQAQGTLQADVPDGRSLTLRARATAQGTLSGSAAALDLTAQIEPAGGSDATPTLAGTARLRPWQRQPVAEADVRLHRLNLSALWPGAPVTALSGTVQARPDADAWRASVRLNNEGAGPLDRQRLPLQRLNADLTQQGARWTLSRLDAEAGGGRIEGQGRLDAPDSGSASATGSWQGELRATGLNPALLWSQLAPAALDASVDARAAVTRAGSMPIDIDARIGPAGRQPRSSALDGLRLRELRLQGRWLPQAGRPTQGSLRLDEARLDVADGTLSARGRIDTSAPRFAGEVDLGLPGARARWQGDLGQTEGNGDLGVDIDDAARLLAWWRRLQGLPWVGEHVRDLLADHPRLLAEGQISWRLRWQGGLGALGFPGGAAAAVAPRIDSLLTAPRFVWQPDRDNDELGRLALDDVRLKLQGPMRSLTLEAQGRATRGTWRGSLSTKGQVELAGALLSGDAGALRLERLEVLYTQAADNPQGIEWSLSSQEPLLMRWQDARNAPRLQVEAASLRLLPTARGRSSPTGPPLRVMWDQLRWQDGALQTRGRLEGLPLAWIDALGGAQADQPGPLARGGLGGDLVFDGQWDIMLPSDAATPPRLSARLQRRSGDLAVQTDGAFDENASVRQRLQAGVRSASIEIDTRGRTVQARLRWDSERFGQITGEVTTDLSPPSGPHTAWHWPDTAPLRGTARASLPQVGVWSVLAPPGWRVRGSLVADATVGGTRAQPRFGGTLQADELALRSLVDGVSFSNGTLRATLAGDRIVIERFTLEGRGGAARGGTLQASGNAEWRSVTREGVARREPLIQLEVSARSLRVSSRADRRLTVTGELGAQLEGNALRLRGKLRADDALLVLPDELAPRLGSDVVVRGTEYPIERSSGVQVVPDVLVDLDLGDSFEVRGQGLQARLTGQLSVRSTPGQPEPRLLGEVRAASGSYRAYGQRLTIESGVLRFSGAYDNPALDITAVRPNSTQRVGVQITGAARTPRVRLFSDPELPDSEKLAWLVLGRPASGAGAEAAVLQQAALALLAGSGGGPLDGGLASALGLDSLSLTGSGTGSDGSTASAALTLGKRLSDQLYVSYERSLAGTLNTVSVFYDVSRRFTIRARAGSENAIDLIFTLQYD